MLHNIVRIPGQLGIHETFFLKKVRKINIIKKSVMYIAIFTKTGQLRKDGTFSRGKNAWPLYP